MRDMTNLLSTRRWVYYIPADAYVPDAGYRVSIVIEHEQGHFPSGDWLYNGEPVKRLPRFWGHDYYDAVKTAREMNEKRGIDAKEAAEIVATSMRGTPQRVAR